MNGDKVVVGDADALIALVFEMDTNYTLATKTSTKLYQIGANVCFPNTAIAEAITTLSRKHSNPDLAAYLKKQYQENKFNVEYVNEKTMMQAADIFNPQGSKQNTFFDAIVAATASQLSADAIFSFDGWYKKLGFKLASDLF